MSMTKSALAIISRSCSITTIVAPPSSSRCSTPISVRTSNGCRPVVGSSSTNIDVCCFLPNSFDSFSRCASPPDSDGVSSPSVRYPNPNDDSVSNAVWMRRHSVGAIRSPAPTCEASPARTASAARTALSPPATDPFDAAGPASRASHFTALFGSNTDKASSTLSASTSGIVSPCGRVGVARRTVSASARNRWPSQLGQGIVTSGRNWMSRSTRPVPSHCGQRSEPVL